MRVLHVTPSIAESYGGPTQSLAGYLTAAQAAGIATSVAAPACDPDEAEYIASRVKGGTLNLFSAVGSGAFTTSPSLVRWVGKSCGSYDVIHVHGLFNSISTFSSRSALARGRPLVIRPFGTLSRYTFKHRRRLLKRIYFSAVERKNVVGAAALHFTTTMERDGARWHAIDFTDRAYVIPPSWSGPIGTAESEGTSAKTVLFLGRLVPVKNIECILDAWISVRSEIPDAVLEIAGDGDESYVRSLRERATSLGVADSIHFRGFVSGTEKQRLLSSAAMLVLPSHHENFGISPFEALAAGVPVIVSPEVQLAEFVRQNDLGRIAAGEPMQFAATILEVMRNEKLRARVCQAAPEIVARTFSPQVIGDSLRIMYKAAIARARAPHSTTIA